MNRILVSVVVGLIGLGSMMVSCGGGSKYTPEQLDSIARAVGPDSSLAKVMDAKYAVVTRQGICAPDSALLFIQSYDGRIYSTNVVKAGDAWNYVNASAADLFKTLSDSTWTAVPDSVFAPEAKAVAAVDVTLQELAQKYQETFNDEIKELNLLATAVCKGKWKDNTAGELQTKMSKGQGFVFSWEYGTDGTSWLAGTTLTPENPAEGLFNIKLSICFSSYDGNYYYSESGKVRFERQDGKYVMVYASNVHPAPFAP